MKNLALFDFDGTITHADTFTPFLHTAIDPLRRKVGLVVLAPLIVGYKLGVVSPSLTRSTVVGFGFGGRKKNELCEQGQAFSHSFLPTVLRPNAMERIQWHKEQGDTVVVVSASLDLYLRPWCETHGLELICNELETRGPVYTGRYLDGDCSGKEKAVRVRARYDLERYATVYAYGDTKEDTELLSLAHKKFYRWKEKTDLSNLES